jgi:hypothetical protein
MMTPNECDVSGRPAAGSCPHKWGSLPVQRCRIMELCEFCHLLRYRMRPGGEWEYRVPIPRASVVFLRPRPESGEKP